MGNPPTNTQCLLENGKDGARDYRATGGCAIWNENAKGCGQTIFAACGKVPMTLAFKHVCIGTLVSTSSHNGGKPIRKVSGVLEYLIDR